MQKAKKDPYAAERERHTKIRWMAFVERTTISEIYEMAINKFVEMYEKKNGKIVFPSGKGIKM